MREAWNAESFSWDESTHLFTVKGANAESTVSSCNSGYRSPFICHETTFKCVICNHWKVEEIHFINFNFIKNVYFLPDGKIKLHKHCQQVESSDVFIPTTEAWKPVYNFVTDV